MEVIAEISLIGPYRIIAGRTKPEDDVHYIVVHNVYGVIEYETEVLAGAYAWATHFKDELEKMVSGEKSDTREVADKVLPFPTNKH